MARRRMHKARARIVAHMRPCEHRHIIRIARRTQRMRQRHRLQLRSTDIANALPTIGLCRFHHALGQLVREDQPITRLDPRLKRQTLLKTLAFIDAVSDLGIERHRAVRRDRPGRRRPDDDARAFNAASLRRKLHPDHRRLAISVFDLRFRQRRLLHRAPHHGLRAALQLSAHRDLQEFLHRRGFRRIRHRQVGIVPVPRTAQPLELGALDVDPLLSIRAA